MADQISADNTKKVLLEGQGGAKKYATNPSTQRKRPADILVENSMDQR